MRRLSYVPSIAIALVSLPCWAAISDVRVVNRTDTQVTVLWTTDAPADSSIHVAGGGSELTATRDESVSHHTITLTGLVADTDYTLTVTSAGEDADGPSFTTGASPTYMRYAAWTAGPPADPSFFPITVWLQSPGNAGEFADLGVDFFTGLWDGPTTEQLAMLTAADMPVVADQNDVALAQLDDPIVLGWSQADEPDNAQSDGMGGYLPCVDPQLIVDRYDAMKAADPSRPVYLNVGQSVAWDQDDPWVGRGDCTGQWDDYPAYFAGADIISFDIYPVTNTAPQIQGNLWRVAQGVDALREWGGPDKIVWNWIETAQIDGEAPPTPHDIRAEVWMSLVHGSMGIGYFVHEFVPAFREDGIFGHPDNVEAVTAINAEIHDLAPVLNTTSMEAAVTVTSSDGAVPIDTMVKRSAGATYVFAVAMRDGATSGTFELFAHGSATMVQVLGEDRTLPVVEGSFTDAFAGYDVHLYRIEAPLDGVPDGGSAEGGADETGGGASDGAATSQGGASEGAGDGATVGGEGASDGAATDSASSNGCGCRSGGRGGAALVFVVLLGVARRRRRR